VPGVKRVLATGAEEMDWADGVLVPAIPAAWQDVWAPESERLDVRDLEVDAQGRLYVLMRSYDKVSKGRVAALLRYDSAGTLDPSFGDMGATLWAINDKAGTDPQDMSIAEDGAILVVGNHYGRWFGTRLDANGVPDLGFGTDSNVTHDYMRGIGESAETAGVRVAALPGGYVVFLVDIWPAQQGCGLVRYTPEGKVDLEFGDSKADGDGWSLIASKPAALVAGQEGRVFVLGMDEKPSGGLAIARDVWLSGVYSY